MNYLFGEDNWKRAYQSPENRKKIWIYIKLSNDTLLFLDDYSKWLTIDQYCKANSLTIKEIGLQYKTNRITENVENYEGIYLVRSLKAEFGASPKQCYTIGRVVQDKIEKKTWILPELTFAHASVDTVKQSFEEAIVNNDKTKTI